MRFVVETRASPEQVRRALTDFSDRRLRVWDRTLDPRSYELRDHGETWAVARESSRGSPFWVVARYDWSDPTAIRWTVEQSSYGGTGHGVARIEPRGDGGSRVHVVYDNTGARSQRLLLFLLHHGPMSRVLRGTWTSALDRYAQSYAG